MGHAATHPSELTKRLTALVLRNGYIRREQAFQLSSGGTSHDYVDMRRVVANGADLKIAAEAVIEYLDDASVSFDAIGGMTMGADPVAHAVALLTGKPWYSVRKAEKTHGAGRRIEGATLEAGVQVVCFEDTVSTGRSLLEACEVVLASGAEINLALTMLDRGEDAKGVFSAIDVPYASILSYADLGIAPLGG